MVTWEVGELEILARQFHNNGIAKGPAFQVASTRYIGPHNVRVGASADGSFVVLWSDDDRIVARRHSAAATPLGSEIELPGRNGDVAVDASGNFIIVATASDDGFGSGIVAQRFDSMGLPLGELLQVNGFTFHDQTDASVCTAAGGDFVIAWTSNQQDGAGTGIFARRFDVPDQPTPPPVPPPCLGDCDGNEIVTVAEMIAGVNIMLGGGDIVECLALDRDRSAQVTVDELVGAVRAFLNGCHK